MLYTISYFTFLEATGTAKPIFSPLYLHHTKNLDSSHNRVLFITTKQVNVADFRGSIKIYDSPPP